MASVMLAAARKWPSARSRFSALGSAASKSSACVAQRAAAGGLGVGRELAGFLQAAMQAAQQVAQVHGKARAQGLARVVDGRGVGRVARHRQVVLARQHQQPAP